MFRINVHEAKTHLSRYLRKLKPGGVIILCRRNVPIAEIRPLPGPLLKPRRIGLFKGDFEVPEAFFHPLSEELIRAFEGRPS